MTSVLENSFQVLVDVEVVILSKYVINLKLSEYMLYFTILLISVQLPVFYYS